MSLLNELLGTNEQHDCSAVLFRSIKRLFSALNGSLARVMKPVSCLSSIELYCFVLLFFYVATALLDSTNVLLFLCGVL